MRLREQSVNCSVTSAARPNLGLENPTFFWRKNEVSTTADMWLQGRTFHFPAN